MAVLRKTTVYVVSEDGLRDITDAPSEGKVSYKKNLSGKKISEKVVEENHSQHQETTQNDCSKINGVINLSEALAEEYSLKSNFNSLSRGLQNGEVILSNRQRNRYSNALRSIHCELQFKCSCRACKAMYLKSLQNACRRSYSGRNTTESEHNTKERLKLPFLKVEKIVASSASDRQLMIKSKECSLVSLEKLPITRQTERNCGKISKGQKMKSITATVDAFKRVKTSISSVKPTPLNSITKAISTQDRNNRLPKESKTKMNPSFSLYRFLPVINSRDQNLQRKLPSTLIPLTNGYLSKSLTRAPVFVDRNTGKSHGLPGVVTFEQKDYNIWSRRNRAQYDQKQSINARFNLRHSSPVSEIKKVNNANNDLSANISSTPKNS